MNTNAAPPLTPDQKAAHIFLTELRTRIATEDLPYQHGVEQTALDSLVTLFGTARKTISDNPGCNAFADLVIRDLNEHLRPVTAKWHPLSQQGVLTSRDGGDAFRAELLELQERMRGLTRKLHEMAYGKLLTETKSEGPMTRPHLDKLLAPIKCGIPTDEQASGGVSDHHAGLINQAEWKDIHRRRTGLASDAENVEAPADAVGLAFSGGGIRSATFCLGVAQVLSEKKLMKDVDYLSTVSGGGYTGSFITRQVGELGDWKDVAAPDGPDTPAIQGVRQQARYLRASGLMDVWEKFVTFTAGTLMNWTMPLVLLIVLAQLFLHLQGRSGVKVAPYVGTALCSAFLVMFLMKRLHQKGWLKGWMAKRPDYFALLLGFPIAAMLWPVSKWTGIALSVVGFGLAWLFDKLITLVGQNPWTMLGVLAVGALLYFAGLSSERKTVKLWRKCFTGFSMLLVLLGLLALLRAGLDLLFIKPEGAQWISFSGVWADFKSWPYFAQLTKGGISLGAVAAVVVGLRQMLPYLQNALVKKIINRLAFLLAALLMPVLAAAVFLVLMLVGHFENFIFCGWHGADVLWLIAIFIGLVAVFVLDINLTGPQRLYRAGLSRTFVELSAPGTDFPLEGINPKGTAPVHLLHGALNLPNCEKPQLRERKCDFFLFSKHFTGSPALGYEPSKDWLLNGRPLDLASAMSISGAAFSANMGQGTVPAVRALLAFINIRLGYWLRRPDIPGKWRLPPWPHPGFVCLLREMFAFGMKADKEAWVNVSDGGHIENLATFELLRRRCKFIVCVDGECDPDFTFHGLMTLVRHARLDLGVSIEPDLAELRPNPETGLSRSHFHLCRIKYPVPPGQPEQTGLLLYLKLSVTGNESEFIKSYRKANPVFPHQTTLDQFFDQSQFEAYRQLGVHVARGLFANRIMNGQPDPKNVREWFERLAQNLLLP